MWVRARTKPCAHGTSSVGHSPHACTHGASSVDQSPPIKHWSFCIDRFAAFDSWQNSVILSLRFNNSGFDWQLPFSKSFLISFRKVPQQYVISRSAKGWAKCKTEKSSHTAAQIRLRWRCGSVSQQIHRAYELGPNLSPCSQLANKHSPHKQDPRHFQT